MKKPTKWLCAQRRLRSAKWVAKDPSFLHADSKDSDQTGRTVTLLVLSTCGSTNSSWGSSGKEKTKVDLFLLKSVRKYLKILYSHILCPMSIIFFSYRCILLRSGKSYALHTIMILSFQSDMSGQTVHTQIRLLLEEQSDQGLHCLQFHLHLLEALLYGNASLFKFRGDSSKFFGCPNFYLSRVTGFSIRIKQPLWILFLAQSSFNNCI